uniref:Peptidase S1 domain-containing protein n=1 Tax=Anisakis simplex TaxID=6269 RepID=A0A0M3JBG7_ANISI
LVIGLEITRRVGLILRRRSSVFKNSTFLVYHILELIFVVFLATPRKSCVFVGNNLELSIHSQEIIMTKPHCHNIPLCGLAFKKLLVKRICSDMSTCRIFICKYSFYHMD